MSHNFVCLCGDRLTKHEGGFCPNGKTWWHQAGKPGIQNKRDPRQSHGGHGWIPKPKCSCATCEKNACENSRHPGKYYSHCGNTCRSGICKH